MCLGVYIVYVIEWTTVWFWSTSKQHLYRIFNDKDDYNDNEDFFAA